MEAIVWAEGIQSVWSSTDTSLLLVTSLRTLMRDEIRADNPAVAATKRQVSSPRSGIKKF